MSSLNNTPNNYNEFLFVYAQSFYVKEFWNYNMFLSEVKQLLGDAVIVSELDLSATNSRAILGSFPKTFV